MKPMPHFLPPRQHVIFTITRRMLDETAMNAASFAVAVAERYLELTAPDVREVKFRSAEGYDVFAAQRHNAQIFRRYMDGSVKTLPSDLEDAWVLSLPEPYRDECEQALARRRGRLSVHMPGAEAGADAAAMAQVMAESGALCSAWARSLADGVVDRGELQEIDEKSDGVIAAVLSLRAHVRAQVRDA